MLHRDEGAAVRLGLELNPAGDEREDGVIAAHADVAAGMIGGSALAHDDISRHHRFAAEFLDTEAAAF